MFTNITRGGQLQIHQLRMLQQIFCFSFIISFAISFALFCRGVSQDIPLPQAKLILRKMKADINLSKEMLSTMKSAISMPDPRSLSRSSRHSRSPLNTAVGDYYVFIIVYFIILFLRLGHQQTWCTISN